MNNIVITNPTTITISDLLQGIFGFLPVLILLVFLAMMVYGGFSRMTAGGDPEKEAASNQILTGAVIGFVIIALAPLLINILGNFLGLGGLIA